MTFGSASSFLFLEIAILMNLAKWIYYFLAIKTQRDIRHYEINMDIFVECEGLNNVSLMKTRMTNVTENIPDFKEI